MRAVACCVLTNLLAAICIHLHQISNVLEDSVYDFPHIIAFPARHHRCYHVLVGGKHRYNVQPQGSRNYPQSSQKPNQCVKTFMGGTTNCRRENDSSMPTRGGIIMVRGPAILAVHWLSRVIAVNGTQHVNPARFRVLRRIPGASLTTHCTGKGPFSFHYFAEGWIRNFDRRGFLLLAKQY